MAVMLAFREMDPCGSVLYLVSQGSCVRLL